MKIYKIIQALTTNNEIKEVKCGQPQTEKELKEMFKFRNDVYEKHNYITKGFYADGLDIDDYDKSGKCVYFTAKVDNKILGTARLIIEDYLPTEKDCFDFEEPEALKNIPRNRRAEVSRLIVEKLEEGNYFPRHLVMLGILDCITEYCGKNSIDGGYSFIKDKLRKKFESIRMPIHIIKDFKCKYFLPTLHDYFNDPVDPVWPIYYINDEIKEYLKILFEVYFKNIGKNKFKFHRNISRDIYYLFKRK